MKTSQDIRAAQIDELNKEILNLSQELFNLKMQKAMGQTVKTHLFNQIKKQIARIKTIKTEKESV